MTTTVPETLPPLASRADAAYLDFVEGFRDFLLGRGSPLSGSSGPGSSGPGSMGDASKGADFEDRLDAVVAAEEQRRGRRFDDLDELVGFLQRSPVTLVHDRLSRTQQEMKWHRIRQSYDAQREALLAELARFDRAGPGRLELDPAFVLPAYANVHFHLQPGGYHKDELGGFHYHYGTKVFFRGENDRDGLHEKLVGVVPPPADGRVQRILDLACSVGQSSTAFKQRFPDAEVWGIDHSAGMLRVAHRRAAMHGIDVNFRQALAEKTGFPDAHFDMVFAFILFHELPQRIVRETVREAARVLRPGGVFAVYDFNPSGTMTPFQRYHRWFDARHNGEPYSQDFCDCDFDAILREHGFAVRAQPIAARSGGAGYMKHWCAEAGGAAKPAGKAA